MLLVRTAFPERPALDAAVGPALLARRAGPLLRAYRPGRTVAFGRLDAVRPGFAAAVSAARAHGFDPVLRSAGGHAAAYHEDTLVLEHLVPAADALTGTRGRFEAAAERLAGALRSLGVDARVGPVDGEYCPGAWTVNGEGRVKLAGTAQRVVRGAALVGAEIVVAGAEPVRAVLADVYGALGLDFDPATAAAVADLAPGLGVAAVAEAVVAAYGPVAEGELDPAALDEARRRESRHAL